MRSPDLPPRFLASIHSRKSLLMYGVLVVCWACAAAWFWVWWLTPAHVSDASRYWTVTALLGWVSFLQLYFIYFFLRAVRSIAPDPDPNRFCVAMIVTKTPSEPFSVLKRTLKAMIAQDYPHDTWLADEDPTPQVRQWCADHGVKISTRKDVAAYHRATWPRRTRCKEGNLAYFYDHWGYDDYDIVSQLDADHVPQLGYLREMLRPFADSDVGYVSAPSICGANADDHWAARTRLHTEGAFHGILQAGYSNGLAPMCIGSHYAVRTAALKDVGGLGPDLAEDHSTTMILNAGGWRGVHALDAIAIGDGPTTVADLAIQEFQWSRSLLTLLLQHTPRYLRGLPVRLKAQFLFCQLLYPILGLTFLAMYLLPIYAVVFDVRFAEVTFPQFLAHSIPQIIALLVITAMLRINRAFRPSDTPIISWERTLFVMLQWPWVLGGCFAALRDKITGQFVDFRITPKGACEHRALPAKITLLYGGLALGCILPVLLVDNLQNAQGFYLLTLFSGLLYSLTFAITVIRHYFDGGFSLSGLGRGLALHMTAVCAIAALFATALSLRAAEGTFALALGLDPVQIVNVKTRVAGAGSANRDAIDYTFDIEFRPTTTTLTQTD